MSTLYRSLPSFATDYSGFLSIMHGLGGLMVVHDPSGCLGNYTNCDEPRWFHDPQSVYSTRLRELEAVLGDSRTSRELIVKEVRRSCPPFVCILGTSVPALTGCDLADLAAQVEEETKVPCYAVDTDGFHFYDSGIAKALSLLYRIMEPPAAKEPNCVNVLGMTPLDYSLYGECDKLTSMIEACGWHVGAFLGMGTDLKAVKAARKAEKNLVMTAAALPLARRMEAEDGIAYFIGPPLGASGSSLLSDFLQGKMPMQTVEELKRAPDTLIIGEQLCANALRRALQAGGYAGRIAVASFFTMDSTQMQESDIPLKSEEQLRALLSTDIFRHVIGDPLFRPLCVSQSFTPRPHPAVSSKLHWKETPSQLG